LSHKRSYYRGVSNQWFGYRLKGTGDVSVSFYNLHGTSKTVIKAFMDYIVDIRIRNYSAIIV